MFPPIKVDPIPIDEVFAIDTDIELILYSTDEVLFKIKSRFRLEPLKYA